ncbi:MAG: nucleotidyltransferase family protein [Verrucomicrobiales bacterium]
MTSTPALVVLAAGMGSRYGGLKQMDPMGPGGEAVLDYSVYDAIRAGFSKIIFVIREDFADDFRATVGARFAEKAEVCYAFQRLDDLPAGFSPPAGRQKPWGTAHAIRAAREEIDRPFAVINADDFYGADAYEKAARFLASLDSSDGGKQECCLVGYQLANTLSAHGSVNRGICQHEEGLLQSVEEIINIARQDHGGITGETLAGDTIPVSPNAIASMNLWAFPRGFLDEIERYFTDFLRERGEEEKSECYIPSVVDHLINAGRLDCHVLETTSSWFGVTYPEDKPHVVASIRQLIEQGEYPEQLSLTHT